MPLTFTVLIPSYRRPEALRRCLQAIVTQQRAADEVLVTVRVGDAASFECARSFESALPITMVRVEEPGVVAAMNAGTAAARGDVIALTDDDAVPHGDWLERIEAAFRRDSRLGALGGRDLIHQPDMQGLPPTQEVGRISWTGRVVGDHHRGTGGARRVEHLKGVNMSWRASAAGRRPFDTDLRGQGAQVFFELAFCLDLARAGWTIVYDPDLQVEHYPAPRHDADQRSHQDFAALANAAFNFNLALRRHMTPGLRRSLALLWLRLIGTSAMPGSLRHHLRPEADAEHGLRLRQMARGAADEAEELVRAGTPPRSRQRPG